MFSLLLLLAADPATPAPRPPVIVHRFRSTNGETVVVPPGCPNGRFQQAESPTDTDAELQPNLTYRADGTVRGYLLLEQSVEGCSRPIVFPLPDRPRETTPEPRSGNRPG